MKSTGEITLIDSKLVNFFIIALSVVMKKSQLSSMAHATCKASLDLIPFLKSCSAVEIIFIVSDVSATAYFFQFLIVSFLSEKGFAAFSYSRI